VRERIVAGGSVAALVAADALAARGEAVRLLLPERGVGGGFAPIERDGRVLELGVRLLELAYEGVDAASVPPLADYRPAIGGHRPYVPLVDRWVRELLGERVVEVERPRMFFDGAVHDDLYFTTDPLALREALDDGERAAILAEARAARAAAGSDAGLLDPAQAATLAALTTDEASLRNHGPTLHDRLIAPLAGKLVPGGGGRVLATYRRKIWVPLFWPATIAQACNGGQVAFAPSRPFHTVAPNGCCDLVGVLRERLQARGATVETAGRLESVAARADGDVALGFSALGEVSARRPVLGPGPGELFAAIGADYAPEQARSVICWVEARPEDLAWRPSLLNVVDPDVPAVRVSAGGRGAPGTALLTVELRHDVAEADIAEAATRSLARVGLVGPDADLNVVMSAAAPTFALPTADTLEAFERARGALAALGLDALVVGGAADFGADALGEQIVHGLQAAEALGS